MTGVETAIILSTLASAEAGRKAYVGGKIAANEAEQTAKDAEEAAKARQLEKASRLKEGVQETQTVVKTKDPFGETDGVAQTMKQRMRVTPKSAANY